MAKSNSKATAKPIKNNTKPVKKTGDSKPVKGSHYTPPDASRDLPPSFYDPIIEKGKVIPDA